MADSEHTQRVDYDTIAHLYDSQPYRGKDTDPEFLKMIEAEPGRQLSVLDMGCGTGNQLVANRPHLPQGRMVGMDLFGGMLRQATPKSDSIHWVQADSTYPPFADNSFDFITNQYSFHHVHDKPGMIQSVFRIMRPGGRFVMSNIDPHRMKDRPLYHYFPASLEADMQHFLPEDTIVQLLQEAGFQGIDTWTETYDFDQDLLDMLKGVKRRDSCSQLLTIPDRAYEDGIRRIEDDIAKTENDTMIKNGGCLLTIRAEKGKDV